MIYWTLDLLSGMGVEEVVLGVNYLAETLRANVGSRYKEMTIKYSLESQELGTAGPIKLAAANTELNETFIAMNGDVIAQIDLQEMLKQHELAKALITDALHEVEDPSRFGVVQLDAHNRIKRFIEKPKPSAAPSHLVNAGIYIIEPEVLGLINPSQKMSLEREIFPALAKEEKLSGFPFSGNWFDIGSLTDYRRANFSMLQDSTRQARELDETVSIATDAVIRRPVFVAGNAKVESQAQVGPNVLLGSTSSIGRRARVRESIVFDGVSIGENSEVYGAILATGVKIGRNVKIGRGVVISPHVTVTDWVRIGAEAIIHPNKEVNRNVRASAHVM